MSNLSPSNRSILAMEVFRINPLSWLLALLLMAVASLMIEGKCSGQEQRFVRNVQNEQVCDSDAVYSEAADEGPAAIALLKQLLTGSCNYSARVALCKLGDANALQELEKQLYEKNDRIFALSETCVRIGNEHALRILVRYMIDDDPELHRSMLLGGDDLKIPLAEAQKIIVKISGKVVIPELPILLRDPKGWYGLYRDKQILWDPEHEVADLDLRRLCRRVDFGFYDAIVEIAKHPGRESEAILRKYPRTNPKLARAGTLEGNLQVAFAILGDPVERNRLMSEMSSDDVWFAISKIDLIGGRFMIQAYRARLGFPHEKVQQLKSKTESSTGKLKRQYEDAYRRAKENYEEIQSHLLSSMADSIINAPSYLNKTPSEANIENWKEWLDHNIDSLRLRNGQLKQ